jgi:peptidoglycan/xylan/chitin deacetylase (PgdA/CDA1 family)
MNPQKIIALALLMMAFTPSSPAQNESGESNETTASEMTASPAERPTGNQLLNLHGVPKDERTILPLEFVWPKKAGEAALCLWKDDKTAVFSLTIDDNCAQNIDWWLRESAARNIKLTWFLVAGGISGKNPAMHGTWERWKTVMDQGHALESHTMTHLSASKNLDTWKGLNWEYRDAKLHLEQNLPGNIVSTLAYPGGGQSKHNDPTVAAKYYIAGRGGPGTLNAPQGLDYLSTRSMTKANLGEYPEKTFNNADNIMNPESSAYRGWCILVFHYVREKDPEHVATVLKALDYAAKHQDQLWIARYPDAVRYAQSRETSQLTVTENSSSRIALQITDRMDDRYFNFPLTVKVRLPDQWNAVNAQQKGQTAASQIVEHGGAKFALVDVIPDGGEAVLTP